MDAKDAEILRVLQKDSRTPYVSLGASVGLSANAVADRVRRMQRAGVIRSFTIDVDESAAEPGRLVVFIDVTLRPDTKAEQFERAVRRLPDVVEAMHVTGGGDYLLRAHVADVARLDRLLRALKTECGAQSTSTRVALRAVTSLGGGRSTR
jgi:Lrp/AsnC family transcriptional regulator, leucine-responsive regulatory protein